MGNDTMWNITYFEIRNILVNSKFVFTTKLTSSCSHLFLFYFRHLPKNPIYTPGKSATACV
jgi:hypothetical protein